MTIYWSARGSLSSPRAAVKIDLSEIIGSIDQSDGSRIILLDRVGKRDRYSNEERARNIFLIDKAERIVWQVQSEFDGDGGPFTKIENENGEIRAFRWDGGSYEISVKTGKATPLSLEK